MVTHIPFLLFFFRARGICVPILHVHVYTCKWYPLFLNFSGSFWKTPHISGDWFINIPFSGFSRESLPERNGQKYPLSPENGNGHAAPCTLEWGPGIITLTFVIFCVCLFVCFCMYKTMCTMVISLLGAYIYLLTASLQHYDLSETERLF